VFDVDNSGLRPPWPPAAGWNTKHNPSSLTSWNYRPAKFLRSRQTRIGSVRPSNHTR